VDRRYYPSFKQAKVLLPSIGLESAAKVLWAEKVFK